MRDKMSKKKKLTFLFMFCLFIFFLSDSIAQFNYYEWRPVNSSVSSDLLSVFTASGYNIAVGVNGMIIRTPVADTVWSVIPAGFLFNINAINSFYIAGDSGKIFRTTNQGLNWQEYSSPANFSIRHISQFFAIQYLNICGDNGLIYRTSNNGTNWFQVNSGTTNTLHYIFFNTSISNYRAYICGDNGNFIKLVINYPPLPAVVESYNLPTGYSNNFYAVAGLADTSSILLAGSGGIIIKSTNGGLNWIQQQSGTTKNLRGIYQLTANNIWICGDSGTVLHTTNGGQNWFRQIVFSNSDLYSITVPPNYRGVAVGKNGTILKCNFPSSTMDTNYRIAYLDGNNIKSYFKSSGIMNQNPLTINTPGFEWPKGSNKYAIFSSGLSIAAYVNGVLKEAMCSYKGELFQGTTINQVPQTPPELNKIYRISRGDNQFNNADWANWGNIVPYGAPFVDVNSNGIYEPAIDTPGYSNASQILFMALTDGFPDKHSPAEGFGGGTLPLFADVRITAWCYSDSILNDVQFIKYDIINKSNSVWDSTIFSLVGDADLGDANDDYVGMDSIRNMWYLYNADNNDFMYGTNPPAVGMRMIKFPLKKNVIPNDTVKSSSGAHFTCLGCPVAPTCETDPNGEPLGAYNFMKGYKKDLSPWMNPVFTPPIQTKFTYSGEPEFSTGWTEFNGRVLNCGGPNGTILIPSPSGDRRYLLNCAAPDFKVFPGDTQKVVIAQMIARGNSNLNSVTKLKYLSDIVYGFYNNGGQLQSFNVSGTVKFADNNQPVTSGYVKALKLHLNTLEFETVDSTGILPDGTYSLPNVRIDSVYIRPYPNSTPIVDFIPTFYPSSINWESATKLYINSNLTNINVGVIRINVTQSPGTISGTVFKPQNSGLNEALVYTKLNNVIKGFAISSNNGGYTINNIPAGTYNVIANRPGYYSDSTIVTSTGGSISNIDFTLQPYYTSVKNLSTEIPKEYKLEQNYPNPFNPETKIKFAISGLYGLSPQTVNLKVYDLLGREIQTLVNSKLQPGIYEVTFDAGYLASGIYFYRLQTESYTETKRMTLVK